MQTTPGLIIFVALPVLLLVGYDIIRRRLYEKQMDSNADALMAELNALRAEKAAREALSDTSGTAVGGEPGQ